MGMAGMPGSNAPPLPAKHEGGTCSLSSLQPLAFELEEVPASLVGVCSLSGAGELRDLLKHL